MRTLLASLMPLLQALAAVDATVMNGTTGKPQAGISVALIQPSQKGMESLGYATSDAAGRVTFAKDPEAGAPSLLQATYKGVTYTKAIQPGKPLVLDIYEVTNQRDGIVVDRHGILLEPGDSSVAVREFVFINNNSKSTYVDAAGTYRFWAPDDAKIEVSITMQGGMPVRRPASKTGTASIWKVDYPMRPGQTQLELSYAAGKPDAFAGNILHKEGETRLIVPRGLSLKGNGLEEFQPEPRTQASIYGIKNGPFEVTITGKAEPPEKQQDEASGGSPDVVPGRPRIYTKLPWILGFAGAMLLVGLYSLAKSK